MYNTDICSKKSRKKSMERIIYKDMNPTLENRKKETEKVPLPKEQRSWIELNLQNFKDNFKEIKNIVGPDINIIAIVKANAYGHGAIEIARYAEKQLDPSHFGIVSLEEARELREGRVKKPILLINYLDPDSVHDALTLNTSITLWDEKVLKAANDSSAKLNKKANIHIKIDTGMHRGGINPDETINLVSSLKKYPQVNWEGIFTHFATADEADLTFARKQLKVFNQCLDQIEDMGVDLPPIIHTANSAAIIQMPETHREDPYKRMTAVRPGIIMYGLPASREFAYPFELKPVLSVKAKLTRVFEIPPGETVGYGRTYEAKEITKVGLVPIGYGDGYRRDLSNGKGSMLVDGQRVPIIGRISMDQTTIDLTNVKNAKVDDEVVIIGRQGKEKISAEELANKYGTIPYEVPTTLNAKRLPRIAR